MMNSIYLFNFFVIKFYQTHFQKKFKLEGMFNMSAKSKWKNFSQLGILK